MSVLRLWFGATAFLLASAMVWEFAPVLVIFFGVLGGLGLIVAGIVVAARAYERRRGAGPGSS